MRNSLLLIIIGTLLSCGPHKNPKLEKMLVGEWDLNKLISGQVPEDPLENQLYNLSFIFYNNNKCDYKPGFLTEEEDKSTLRRRIITLGNETRFEVEDITLKIVDPRSKKWLTAKIEYITKDSLILKQDDSTRILYTRVIHPSDSIPFDKIIVYTSPCFGTCPVAISSIDHKGNFIFHGEHNTTKNGLFYSEGNQENFLKIERAFKRFPIDKLPDAYSTHITDNSSTTIMFLKDNKVIKRIKDHGTSPNQFFWAHQRVSYLYQTTALKPVKNEQKKWVEFSFFERNGKICWLDPMYRFHLASEIFMSKEVHETFQKKYLLKSEGQDIPTDGRFYLIKVGNTEKTYDLGYNFLEVNEVVDKFVKKHF
jgi:hypothetical protein